MKEGVVMWFSQITFNQVMILLTFIAVFVIALLLTLDRMNIKSFSFKTGLTFYQDGETKRSRITRRAKVVRRKAK